MYVKVKPPVEFLLLCPTEVYTGKTVDDLAKAKVRSDELAAECRKMQRNLLDWVEEQ